MTGVSAAIEKGTILRRSALMALICLVPALVAWEWHWRNEGYHSTPDSTKHLWAVQRGKVKGLGADDVIVIGSSRVLFDIQIYEWEDVTGRRPLQLAMPGATPMPVLEDLATKTDFAGTVIVGVTPGLFFQSVPGRGSWDRPAANVEHYYKRTYAQRFNHWLGMPLQKAFSFLQNDDLGFYNELDLETIIQRIPFEGRVEVDAPFPMFRFEDKNRNVTMWDRVTRDTAYAAMIKYIWQGGGTPRTPPDSAKLAESKETVLKLAADYVSMIQQRGGQVIFVRCPSTGWYLESEESQMPRSQFWDVLLARTGAPGYTFEDYEFMQGYDLPEWSHMATPDARVFTRALVQQMVRDGLIRTLK